MSRTRKILDILDQLASTASLANDTPNTSTNNTSLLNTRKWLHDISVGRMPGGGPPRTTLRTPSRLYSIVTNLRDKPYWKRPTEMAAAAEKRKEVSFEADTEPDDAEAASNKSINTNNSTELPKAHKSILKSYTGRNVAGSIKSNIFNTDIIDLEADISSIAETKKTLESVKPPSEFGKNLESGFLTKNRIFTFSKPIIRGPQAVIEKSFEKGDSSSDESSMDDDDEESDKEVEIVSTKATNSDTSTSSPENSKLQKPPSPVTKEPTPILLTNAPGSWDCPECWVSNKASDDKCQACQTPKAGTTNNANAWECPTCMVNNKGSDDKCPCCQTSKPGTANNVATSNNAAPQPVFKATQFKPVPTSISFGFKPPDTSAPKPDNAINGTLNNSTNLFNAKPNEPAVAPVVSPPAPSFPAFGQQTATVPKTEPDTNSTSNVFSKPAATTPFTINSAAPVSGFKFGVTAEQPATNGTFQFSGSNSSSNMFNLPLPSAASQLFSAPAPAFPGLGQQNTAVPKTEPDTNSTSNIFSKPVSATPFTFNATAPVSGFNFGLTAEQPSTNGTFQFGGSTEKPSTNGAFQFGGTTEQPATNGTFQFGGSNSSSNLFNLPLPGAAQPFSAPAPSFPALGQQNVFMPISGGGSASSNNRKIILAKRQRKR